MTKQWSPDDNCMIFCRGLLKPVKTKRIPGKVLFCKLQEVVVMGEKDDLGAGRELGQNLQGGGGTVIVKLDQDIVHDEGHGFGFFDGHLKA